MNDSTVCRRAERGVVPLINAEEVDPEVGVYLNRCVFVRLPSHPCVMYICVVCCIYV